MVVHEAVFVTRMITPATLFGKGQVEMAASALRAADVGVVVVNAALTPVQQRNLETAWGAKVIDRTGLILDIFGARARTREGTLQVELAHLEYQRSRLVRSWTHLRAPARRFRLPRRSGRDADRGGPPPDRRPYLAAAPGA